ncbi:MAG TPA: SCO family protein [Pyrinomonadaceae bacterium]|nr:SCO family protein [Pyrinomonadaceae bacterium]
MSLRTRLTILVLIIGLVPVLPAHRSEVTAQTVQKQAQKKIRRYSCPMHPEVVYKRAGKCPKCGMSLRLVKEATAQPAATIPDPPPVQPATNDAAFLSKNIPDVQIYDQTGRRLNFYSDLIKGKTVAINFIFTTCTGVCPPLTATFRRVQQDLAKQGLPAQLISISVDPVTDTPARLQEFAAKFKAAPGWTFVTGDKSAIDSILQALGTAVANKTDHTSMILIGNDVTGEWTRAYGLSSPAVLINVISRTAKGE